MSNKQGVILTNDDASYCKLAAVKKGYWEDKYLDVFCTSRRMKSRKHSPLIHRGYYARTMAVYSLTKKFLDIAGAKAQIVNLGCGYDTLFWRLVDQKLPFSRFCDLDLKEVVSQKQTLLENNGSMLDVAKEHEYYLKAANLEEPDSLMTVLSECNIDLKAPTLFITECVLVYFQPPSSVELLKTLGKAFNQAFFVNYEMINALDAFGKVMLKNLEERGCPLLGLPEFPNVEAHRKRFESCGWHCSDIINMNEAYARLEYEDVKRIEKLEIFDEFEEWTLINNHYIIGWAYRDESNLGFASICL
eukprot:m.74049 g.74049  ORF g.74049 m.74049 type:complete len:303 (+) comp12444_c0_seq5:339-1247(+)